MPHLKKKIFFKEKEIHKIEINCWVLFLFIRHEKFSRKLYTYHQAAD